MLKPRCFCPSSTAVSAQDNATGQIIRKFPRRACTEGGVALFGDVGMLTLNREKSKREDETPCPGITAERFSNKREKVRCDSYPVQTGSDEKLIPISSLNPRLLRARCWLNK